MVDHWEKSNTDEWLPFFTEEKKKQLDPSARPAEEGRRKKIGASFRQPPGRPPGTGDTTFSERDMGGGKKKKKGKGDVVPNVSLSQRGE